MDWGCNCDAENNSKIKQMQNIPICFTDYQNNENTFKNNYLKKNKSCFYKSAECSATNTQGLCSDEVFSKIYMESYSRTSYTSGRIVFSPEGDILHKEFYLRRSHITDGVLLQKYRNSEIVIPGDISEIAFQKVTYSRRSFRKGHILESHVLEEGIPVGVTCN